MKHPLLIILFLLFGGALGSAKTDLEWLEEEYDFGLIKEDGGPAEGIIQFINRAKKPVKIEKVEVSCGCTVAEYSKNKIGRGDTAEIKVTFDPEDRPGKFYNYAKVYFKGETEPKTISIYGTVMASEETLKLWYPNEAGDLHLDASEVDFGEIEKGVRRREFVEIYNSAEEAITPEFITDTGALSYRLSPETIPPGDVAILTLNLNSGLEMFTGDRYFKVKLKTSDGKEQTILRVKAKILPKVQP